MQYSSLTNSFGYGGDVQGWNANLGSGNDGTASCTGAITTTFEWQPDYLNEPPPTKVIVVESSDVGYADALEDTAEGSCDDGLGNAEADYYAGDP